LRIKQIDVYRSLEDIDANYDRIVNGDLNRAIGSAFWNTEDGGLIEGMLLISLKNGEDRSSRISTIRRQLTAMEKSSRNSPEHLRLTRIYDGIVAAQNHRVTGALQSVLNKLGFASKFT
jgi:hypothetical protein